MRAFLWKWTRRASLALLALVALLSLLIAVTPQGRAGFHTALFVLQVLDVPVKPQGWFTAKPARVEVSYPQANGTGQADLYRIPDDRQRAAVLIFLGANAAGRDDADVVNLGNALARAGFVAMFHWSPTMALQYNIDEAELENLVWAFRYLRKQGFVDPQRVGIGGFCVGASFALVAAADPRIRGQVQFVNAFGPYYDAHDLLVQIASRSRIYQGKATPWNVDRLTLKVFANELIETVSSPADKELLTRRFLDNAEVPGAELDTMGPEAQLVRKLLEGTTPEEAERLYQQLPESFKANMRRISPSGYLANIKARLMIMHERDDQLIPVAESRRLVAALAGQHNYRYTEVTGFNHVRPGRGGRPWELLIEAFKLYRHLYGIIREAH